MDTADSEGVADQIRRYQSLGLRESLSQTPLYLYSCRELSFILRNGCSRFPKHLRLILFQDTLFAFSLLPKMQSQSAISAAYALMQSSEMVFPKLKRSEAVMEYKRAVIASKRKIRQIHEEEEEEGRLTLFPQDILLQVFGLLDLHSLVSASAVCRSWNAIAGDHHLWRSLYAMYFCNHGILSDNDQHTFSCVKNHSEDDTGVDWKFSLKMAYEGTYFRKYRSNRGYCFSCSSLVWLNANKCYNESSIKDGSTSNHRIRPISIQQVVDYIFEGSSSLTESSSDSDSDGDDIPMRRFKLWAIPTKISRCSRRMTNCIP